MLIFISYFRLLLVTKYLLLLLVLIIDTCAYINKHNTMHNTYINTLSRCLANKFSLLKKDFVAPTFFYFSLFFFFIPPSVEIILRVARICFGNMLFARLNIFRELRQPHDQFAFEYAESNDNNLYFMRATLLHRLAPFLFSPPKLNELNEFLSVALNCRCIKNDTRRKAGRRFRSRCNT